MSKCGCGNNSKKFGKYGCCDSVVQSPPSPCCEAHFTKYITSVCFRPTANVVTVDDEEGFWITFENPCDEIPMNATESYFYHASAGFLKFKTYDGTSYNVTLVDITKAGVTIEKGDCVAYAAIPTTLFTAGLSTRCLVGIFTAPALDANQTIYILNGSGIPEGSIITFTNPDNGQVGSYEVQSYVTSENNIYTYVVQNTGAGHTPLSTIDGGAIGSCTIPIEVITEVDLCSLATSDGLDTITGCVNGSPRSLESTSEDDVIGGDGSGGWEPKRAINLDCCVVIDGCLKFSGKVCAFNSDSVELRDTNLECFEAALEVAENYESRLAMNINGFRVVVLDYDSETKIATFQPAEDTTFDEFIQFDAGTQICIGECCASCQLGPETTDIKTVSGATAANFAIDDLELAYDSDFVLQYLVGFNTSGTATSLAIDDTYNNSGLVGIIGKPLITNPLLIRQNICNQNTNGCDLEVELDFNWELQIADLPEGMLAEVEIGHFAAESEFLSDGVTLNPFFNISTAAKSANQILGPSFDATARIGNTSLGYGVHFATKYFPYNAGVLRDYFKLVKCDCALSVLWLHITFRAFASVDVDGDASVSLNVRRRIKTENSLRAALPANDYDSPSWN